MFWFFLFYGCVVVLLEQLTGIVQSMLADKPSLKTVLISLDEWMQNNSITQTNSAVVTFGEWDMASAYVMNCFQYIMANLIVNITCIRQHSY